VGLALYIWTTAAKCTLSYIEDNASQALQFHRSAAYGAVTCTWDKYLAGTLTLSQADEAIANYLTQSVKFSSGYTTGVKTWTDKDGKPAFPEKWPIGVAPSKLANEARNEFQHRAGQTIPPDTTAGTVGTYANLPVVGNLMLKGVRLLTIDKFSQGPCPQFTKGDVSSAIKDVLVTYFKTVATIQGGEAKKAFDAVQSLAAGSPSGVVMEALYSLLSDYGIEVPEEVKKFLNCLYSKAGGLVFTAVKQAVIDGDPKGAAQLLAPYAIACSAKTAKDSLEAGSIWAPLIDAIALAAVVATAPPPPPAPKVPVVDAKSECEQTGGIVLKNGACFKLDEKSIGFAAYASSGEVLKAQEKIYNAAAEGVKKKNEEKKKQEEQQQLLLIAGAAVVAYLALS